MKPFFATPVKVPTVKDALAVLTETMTKLKHVAEYHDQSVEQNKAKIAELESQNEASEAESTQAKSTLDKLSNLVG